MTVVPLLLAGWYISGTVCWMRDCPGYSYSEDIISIPLHQRVPCVTRDDVQYTVSFATLCNNVQLLQNIEQVKQSDYYFSRNQTSVLLYLKVLRALPGNKPIYNILKTGVYIFQNIKINLSIEQWICLNLEALIQPTSIQVGFKLKSLPIAMTKLQDNLVVILTFPCNEIHPKERNLPCEHFIF